MHLVLTTVTMFAVGCAIWVRRQSWRSVRWQQALTLAVVLLGVGFFLCLPAQGPWLGRALFAATGIAHIRDYLGHLALLSAVSSIIFAVAYRLVPRDEIDHFMARVELPGALAAFAMLISITLSHSTHHQPIEHDFMDVPVDAWLRVYWLTYCGTLAYLVGVLIWMLVVLRRDGCSRRTSDLIIAAASLWLAADVVRLGDMLVPSLHIPNTSVWALATAGTVLASLAAGLSGRRVPVSR